MDNYVICQCCGKRYRTHSFRTDIYTICPNCSWEQDPFIEDNKSLSYTNGICIAEARNNIKDFGNIYRIMSKKGHQIKVKLYIKEE